MYIHMQISVDSSNVQFRVGVAQTPLPEDASRWNCSWCIQADTGALYFNGEPTESTLFTLVQGDTLTLEYNSSSNQLSLGKNSEELMKAFGDVFADGKELSPFVHFLNAEGPRKVTFCNSMDMYVYLYYCKLLAVNCACEYAGCSSSDGVCCVSFDVPSSSERAAGVRLPYSQSHQCHSHPDCCWYPLSTTK